MTKEQYNDFVHYLEIQIMQAEMTIANIEDRLGSLEHKLEIHRDRNEWSSYGVALDRMQARLREREYWKGRLQLSKATLEDARKANAE
jgi:predicted  nucleic acid-binding Zn-ribbon protein